MKIVVDDVNNYICLLLPSFPLLLTVRKVIKRGIETRSVRDELEE